ncbi:Ctr copper transporter family-domain-containing protein [Sparassis latifolia]|uniref:Copper transport protein n=1 Tax=Sparassis crispa TaxID=139825 RepID=A0A401G7J5_9APHY|nr:hypothetical protein SCP_0110280 [Sparassis crispa]GBE78145.1 hypothetical protein SCP_0110280 [Sparassis crispa]
MASSMTMTSASTSMAVSSAGTLSMTPSSPMSTSMSSSMTPMVPYLHFIGGDSLLFKPWAPSSHGAIAGACFGLIALAIVERWVSAMRAVLEAYWRRRMRAIIVAQTSDPPTPSKEKSAADVEAFTSRRSSVVVVERPPPIFPPFIWQHDFSRGALLTLQALLAYAMMLAIMTFQAAYLISVVVGLGIGEVMFGRWASGGSHLFH